MSFEHTVRRGKEQLRRGYTTGTCAALAAAGAARLLLTGQAPEQVSLVTPAGLTVALAPSRFSLSGGEARYAVVKDSGDDPDVTNGMEVAACVSWASGGGIRIDGGEGVGRVTRPGLDQPVGAAAINRVPRRMIEEQVQAVRDQLGSGAGLQVVISIPGGEERAKRTFNPALGIEGGLSVLGTSGIVEPMSEQAILDTIALEQRQAAAGGGTRLILTPGNYGMDFLRGQGWDGWGVPAVKCSNFIGDSLDIAATLGFSQVLLVGHAGKLVKLAGGVMNTHSRYADCRGEVFCAHAALCGGDAKLCRELMEASTSDACIALLDGAGLRRMVLDSLAAAVQKHLDRRSAGAFAAGAVLFSNQYGLLTATTRAKELMEQWNTAK